MPNKLSIAFLLLLLFASYSFAENENSAQKPIYVAAIQISTYDTEDPIPVGGTTTYVIEVMNEGTANATNVIIIDETPDYMQFLTAQSPTKYKVENKIIIFEPVPQLLPGEKVTYRIVCKAIEGGSAKNKASLTYDQFSLELIDEEGTSIYQ